MHLYVECLWLGRWKCFSHFCECSYFRIHRDRLQNTVHTLLFGSENCTTKEKKIILTQSRFTAKSQADWGPSHRGYCTWPHPVMVNDIQFNISVLRHVPKPSFPIRDVHVLSCPQFFIPWLYMPLYLSCVVMFIFAAFLLFIVSPISSFPCAGG